MKRIKTVKRVTPALIALISCLIAIVPAYGQALNSTTNSVTPSTVMGDLLKLETWVFLFVILISGALGGFVYELLTFGGLEKPHWLTKEEIDGNKGLQGKVAEFILSLGIISRIIIGAFAALASLLFLSPANTIQLLAMGIIAGSIGTSIFRSMQDRIVAMLAVKEANKAKDGEAMAVKEAKDAKEGETKAKEEKSEVLRVTEKFAQGTQELLASKSSDRELESIESQNSEGSDHAVILLKAAHELYQSIQRK